MNYKKLLIKTSFKHSQKFQDVSSKIKEIRRQSMSTIEQTVEELVHPILEEKNLELIDVEYVKEGNNWYLRVYIDKENGVDIDECSIVSEQLGSKLDEIDPIEGAYFLEVSSPGARSEERREGQQGKQYG